MALDSLQKIKSVEEEAEGKIRAARQQIARAVEEAKKKQEDAFLSSEKSSKEALRQALGDVEEEAKKLQEEQDKQVAQERQRLRESAEAKMPDAVKYIISEIFK